MDNWERLNKLSKINVKVEWNGDHYQPYAFEWEGDSDEIAITYTLWNDVDPEYVKVDTINNVHSGYEFYFGPFHLRVTEVDAMRELIFCQRIMGE